MATKEENRPTDDAQQAGQGRMGQRRTEQGRTGQQRVEQRRGEQPRVEQREEMRIVLRAFASTNATADGTKPAGKNPVETAQQNERQAREVEAIVRLWNQAYREQRNFMRLTPELFRRRVLECPAFQREGLILAWEESAPSNRARAKGERRLVGMIHALRPMPAEGVYARWGPQPGIAHLYVDPGVRRRGVGSRLLQAAENWLYYCPVYIGAPGQACYGAVEGPRPPLFGSTQALGLDAGNTETIRFFANRGYRPHEPGDVSLRVAEKPPLRPVPDRESVLPRQVRLREVSHLAPFTGQELPGREEYTLWGDNGGAPYAALLLVDNEERLQGHISWYPMARAGHAAIASFWLSPHLRGRKLGAYLLDSALQRIYTGVYSGNPTGNDARNNTGAGNNTVHAPLGRFDAVEVHTHTVRHPVATRLYEARGFQLEAAWAALVKM